jgi:hypothetical protein
MMKNVGGQFIGVQMTTISDGSPFTGSVTVHVTVDAGTQATGTVGSGACTHEGNGFHTYAPSQAETNGTHVAFTFTGTGALAKTEQVYPSSITGDAFARLGAPAGASIAADIAALPTSAANADKLLGRNIAGSSDGGRTVTSAFRAVRNKVDIVRINDTTGTINVYAEDDTTLAWTGTVTRAAENAPIRIDPA